MGNITRDPEIRYTSGGTALCVLGLAVNRKFTTSKGEDREETCFVDVEVWGRQAENCNNYLRKGSPVFVEGRLRYDQWDDRETGKKRSRLLVNSERLQFLGAPSRSAGFHGSQQSEPPGMQNEFAPNTMPPPFPANHPIEEKSESSSMPAAEEKKEEPMDDIPF